MQMIPVVSSDIASIGYEHDVLEVHFLGGGIYQYFHVPETVFIQFKLASSKGKFLHARIKGHYPFRRLR